MMTALQVSQMLALLLVFYLQGASCFQQRQPIQRQTVQLYASNNNNIDEYYNVVLKTTDSGATPVRIRITQEGSGQAPKKGDMVSIEYKGTLAKLPDGEEYWTPQDVVECWLSEQQGLQEGLGETFVDNEIDSTKLLDPEIFTENFVAESLGVSNKIQCKKLVMAAKRLANERREFQTCENLEFDSSERLGKPFAFPLGQNKAIQAMDMAVAALTLGAKCELLTRCDYAYGKEGLRTSKGDMRIPPFATLKFEIELVKIE